MSAATGGSSKNDSSMHASIATASGVAPIFAVSELKLQLPPPPPLEPPCALLRATAAGEAVPGGGASFGGALREAEANVDGSAPIGVAGRWSPDKEPPAPLPLAIEYAAPPLAAGCCGGSSPFAMASAVAAARSSPLAAWRWGWVGKHRVRGRVSLGLPRRGGVLGCVRSCAHLLGCVCV